MKREGRQHGMVRTHRILPSPWNPKPQSRFINSFDSPPTAGFFTKVHPKPTNHSKFTGKCGKPRCNECHMQPCCKSKDKTKGTQKLRSLDGASNYKSITWRVVDGRPGLNFTGFSASGILDHLAINDDYVGDDDDVDVDVDDEIDGDYNNNYLGNSNSIFPSRTEMDHEIQEIAAAADGNRLTEEEDNNNYDNMSFCDVDLLLDQVEGDEGWCLVEEKCD